MQANASDIVGPKPVPYRGQALSEEIAITRTSQYVAMKDGTKIAVDVYLPSTWKPGQRLPTILHQTRYWRAISYRWPLSAFKESLPRGLTGQYAKRFLEN